MPRTSPLVSFGLYALTIKQDSTPVCADVQSFSKVADLKTGNITSRPYITYEPDYWLLDGGYKFKPVDDAVVHVGLWSLSMSDVNGNFAVTPQLTVSFTDVHTTDGITLRFAQYSNDYANHIDVSYYNALDVLIRTDTYYPANWEFSTGQAVTDFKKIVVTFYSTNKPYRYLRLTGIDYGTLIYFTSADIKSAIVAEQIDPLSVELPIDTLELNLFSSNSAFSMIDPSGEYANLQNRQPMDVYETVGNEQVYIGQFYLNEWENPSNNEIQFRCIDMIGVLDTMPYLGDLITAAQDASDVIDALLTGANIPYELDLDLYTEQVKGWIPVSTYREALQQIAFAIGAYVTCSRAGIIQIRKTVLASELITYENTITKAQKGLDQSLTLKKLVTGVDVTAHNYVANTDVTELYNGTLAVGTHTIVFSAPMHDLDITGATIVTSGANYAILSVASPGTVVLIGEGYTDTKAVTKIETIGLDPNVRKNTLTVTDATLVNPANVETVTQRVYDYYQQRYLQKVKLYAPSAEPGKSVLIDTLYDQHIAGIVEKMTLNLAGGFTVQTEITGVVQGT